MLSKMCFYHFLTFFVHFPLKIRPPAAPVRPYMPYIVGQLYGVPHGILRVYQYIKCVSKSSNFWNANCTLSRAWFKNNKRRENMLQIFIEFCHNIEEIQIDGLSSDSQLAHDLSKLLPTWVLPNGVIFNPKYPQVTLKNVTYLEMNPDNESDFSFGWKDIFSQNLYRLDLNFIENLSDDDDDYYDDNIFALFCQNVLTFLQETHLKHHWEMLDIIAENCQSVTKYEWLAYYDGDPCGMDGIEVMTTLKQLTISQHIMDNGRWKSLQYLDNLMELQIFETEIGDEDLMDIAQNCPKLVKLIYDAGTRQDNDHITLDGIKAYVQECCSKDSINHIEINVDLEGQGQDCESLVQLVNDNLPKIAIFKVGIGNWNFNLL
jgi:hypothetical protein